MIAKKSKHELVNNNSTRNIVFSGGGTGGSVTPLLAIAEELLKENNSLNLFFVGSKEGVERKLIENFKGQAISFLTISSGKWRRYFSLANFFDFFKIFIAFFQSFKILKNTQADLVISAGSFVSVPLVWAAAFKKVPILIHQQDIRPGLANKLMAPWARVVTISFEKSFADYGPRAVWTGNPLKDVSVYQNNIAETVSRYNLKSDLPIVVVIGGGTGALALNKLVQSSLNDLTKTCQIIHFTGKNKQAAQNKKSGATPISSLTVEFDNYQAFDFLDQGEVLSLLAVADLVVSRCGLGVLTELVSLAKAAILIPMPNSHQEDNAAVFANHQAAIVLNQEELTADKFKQEILNLLADANHRQALSNNIGKIMKARAAESISAIIWEILAVK